MQIGLFSQKEIWESDVVRVFNYLNGKIWKGHVHDCEVIFIGGKFELKNHWCHESFSTSELEVIGNRFENPELLEK